EEGLADADGVPRLGPEPLEQLAREDGRGVALARAPEREVPTDEEAAEGRDADREHRHRDRELDQPEPVLFTKPAQHLSRSRPAARRGPSTGGACPARR